jgi:hypothetical protein
VKKSLLALMLIVSLTPAPIQAAVSPVISSEVRGTFIERQEARNIFLLKKRKWSDGTLVMVYRLPLDSRAHQQFVREILGITPEQYTTELKKLKANGLEGQIKEVFSQKEMLVALTRSRNAVGYLDRDYLILNGGNSLQVLHLKD